MQFVFLLISVCCIRIVVIGVCSIRTSFTEMPQFFFTSNSVVNLYFNFKPLCVAGAGN